MVRAFSDACWWNREGNTGIEMDMASWRRNRNGMMRDQYANIVNLHIERM